MKKKSEKKDRSVRTGGRDTRLFWMGLFIAVGIALAANADVLWNGFGWDDKVIIRDLKTHDPAQWWRYAVPLFGDTARRAGELYLRPLVGISYQIDYQIWGDGPFGFHFSVWLAHALNTALVFFLGYTLVQTGQARGPAPADSGKDATFGRNALRPYNWVPLLAAAIFAVHPIHPEAVAWIAGRNDVFCTTLLLASALFYLRFIGSRFRLFYFLAMLGFFLALLTKEVAVAMILMFPLMDFLDPARNQSSPDKGQTRGSAPTESGGHKPRPHSPLPTPYSLIFIRFVPPLLILAYYFVLRASRMTKPFGGGSGGQVASESSIEKWIAAYGWYLKHMFFPYPHTPFMAFVPSSGLWMLFSILALAAGAAGFILAALRGYRLPAFSVAWMFLLLAPGVSVAVVRVAATPAAERYAYAATAGWAIAAAWMIVALTARMARGVPSTRPIHGVVALVMAGCVLLWGAQSWARNKVWFSTMTFWQASVASAPDSGFPHRELATTLYKDHRYDEAEPLYRKAIELDEKDLGPDNPYVAEALNGLAALYYEQKKYAEAEPLYLRVLKIKEALKGPDSPDVGGILNNLGSLYNIQGRFDKAEPYYLRSLAVREKTPGPDSVDVSKTLNNLGGLYYNKRRYREAEEYFRRSLAIRKKAYRPDHPMIGTGYSNLAAVSVALGKLDEARGYYEKAIAVYEDALGPSDPNLLQPLKGYALLLHRMKRDDEAKKIEDRIRRMSFR